MTTAIRVEGLGKRYELGRSVDPHRTVRDLVADVSRAAARRALRLVGRGDAAAVPGEFWALRDVSLEVARGEAVGLIGGNGAGKSTLLKIVSRITAPTTGRVEIRGRVGSLLEVGTGFHPDLTGRENVYLNGAILGMRRGEIDRKFDEIVAFAEVDRFIDTPVKRYSSGMYLRLAFAVAAHLDSEVLLVDEVLAVGDAAFQEKCLGRMSTVATAGRTVIFVSHNMESVQRLCGRVLLMARGGVVASGDSHEVTARYLLRDSRGGRPGHWLALGAVDRYGSGEARFVAARYEGADGGAVRSGGPLAVEVEVEAADSLVAGSLAVVLYDRRGTKLVNADTVTTGQRIRLDAGRTRVRVEIEAVHLNAGTYRVGLWLAHGPMDGPIDFVEHAFELEVVPAALRSLGTPTRSDGLVPCRFQAHRLP